MKVRIRRGILVTLLGLLLLSSFAIWAAGAWVGHATAQELSVQLMAKAREAVTLRLHGDLQPAHALARLNAGLLRDGVFTLTPENRERLLSAFEVQVAHYGVDAVFVGTPDGEFWMVRRTPDGGTRRIVLPPPAARGHNGWEAPEPQYEDFDPRERAWYREATPGGHWTEVYPFRAGHPGITVSAQALGAADGRLLGVVGVDVALDDLTAFVARLEATANSRVFLLDHRHCVIAHPDASLQLRPVAELDAQPGSEAALLTACVEAASRPRRAAENNADAAGRPVPVDSAGLGRHYVVLAPLDSVGALPQFVVGVAVPELDVLGPFLDNRFVSLVIGFVTIGLGALFAVWITRGIARPLEQLEREMGRVQQMDLDVNTTIATSYTEVAYIVDAFGRMVHGLRSFARYVPREVVRGLIASGKSAEIGGEERELSIMFTDIVGFTSDTEASTAREVFEHLGEYLQTMTAVIRSHRGTLDKFIGDAVMAFWNAPLPVENHPTLCALAAVDAQAALAERRERWLREGKPPYATRIGLTCARVMVGNVGSTDRFNYTALGDGVNLASRLEAVNKHYGTWILADDQLAQRCDPQQVLLQPVDVIAVKGREAGVRLYEVLGRPADVPAARQEAAGLYAEALKAYGAGSFLQAAARFREVLRAVPGYRPAEVLSERCDRLASEPPAAWTGVYVMREK